ncbi:hypothetical protein VNO77_27058 [Canavalia gladiata]|uniref:Uncharacterized protein n=1 Tax=Canavalia gladiata TaxID=3824 RepID=A0AAN9KUP4_CANGL
MTAKTYKERCSILFSTSSSEFITLLLNGLSPKRAKNLVHFLKSSKHHITVFRRRAFVELLVSEEEEDYSKIELVLQCFQLVLFLNSNARRPHPIPVLSRDVFGARAKGI